MRAARYSPASAGPAPAADAGPGVAYASARGRGLLAAVVLGSAIAFLDPTVAGAPPA